MIFVIDGRKPFGGGMTWTLGTLMIVVGVVLLFIAGSQPLNAPNDFMLVVNLSSGLLCIVIGIMCRRSAELPKEPNSIVTTEENRRSRALQAAKGSWAAPLLALLVSTFGSQFIEGGTGRAIAITLMVAIAILILLGIAFAVFALSQVNRYGSRGLTIPAIIGLLFSVAVAAIFLLPFLLMPKRH